MTSRYAGWLAAASTAFAAGAALALWRSAADRQLSALAVFALAALFAGQAALLGHEALGRSNSSHYIAKLVTPLLAPGVPFYSVGMYEQTLPFYIERTVTLVDYEDEFAFGLAQEPQLAVATMDAFAERWTRDPQAFAIFTPDGWNLVRERRLPMEVVARDERRVIVRKPAAAP
jgi:hypothetical protein